MRNKLPVRAAYTPHNSRAVEAMRGVRRSVEIPGASAWNSWAPPTPMNGRIATPSTMMPIPPIQWEMLRHRRIERGRSSMTGKMVAPVVVNPETDSKNAPTTFGATPVRMKGRLPMVTRQSQPSPTTTKPARRLMSIFLGVRSQRARPANAVAAADTTHPQRFPSSPIARRTDGTIATDVHSNSAPTTLKTARMFMASRLADPARGVKGPPWPAAARPAVCHRTSPRFGRMKYQGWRGNDSKPNNGSGAVIQISITWCRPPP